MRTVAPTGTEERITAFTCGWMEAEFELWQRVSARHPVYRLLLCGLRPPGRGVWRTGARKGTRDAHEFPFGNRGPKQVTAEWQAHLDLDCRRRLATCTEPVHVVANSQDVRTRPGTVREITETCPNGAGHEFLEVGHVSSVLHRPDSVATLLRRTRTSEKS